MGKLSFIQKVMIDFGRLPAALCNWRVVGKQLGKYV